MLIFSTELSSGLEAPFINWGHKCLGPRASLGWITEHCPRNARLEWTTAKVKPNRLRTTIDFDIRCIECAKEYELSEFYQSYGILADDEEDKTDCDQVGCCHTRLYRARYCSLHILSHTVGCRPQEYKERDQDVIRRQIAPPQAQKWKMDKSSRFALFLNRRKTDDMARFFVVDVEGQISKKPPIIEQIAAVDIDLIHKGDHQALFNLNINRGGDIDRTASINDDTDFTRSLLRFRKDYYWNCNKARLSGIHVDAARAASVIKESGITPKDYIIVWHKNTTDVSAIRHLLSQAGFQGILPSDEHVIRLPYLFRHNLDLPKGTQCALEFLFAVFFPSHPLRLTHHDALIDSQKTVLMALMAKKLCNGEE